MNYVKFKNENNNGCLNFLPEQNETRRRVIWGKRKSWVHLNPNIYFQARDKNC